MTDVLKIFGPPGTGKTTRLLGIMERELAGGIPPDRLAYVSFTVAARQEAKDRAQVKFGFTSAELKWFRTLHSCAYELQGVNNGALLTGDQGGLAEFAERFGYEFTSLDAVQSEMSGRFGFKRGDKLLAFDHFRRHRQLDIITAWKQWPEALTRWEVEHFVNGYQRWKEEESRLDFTDLLEGEMDPLPCDVVIVDEAQDLSPLQWKVLWHLARNAKRVYIAGDDDQAIYEWAGADPRCLLDQPGAVEVLPQSYRCPENVTRLAQALISKVRVRQPKEWRSREGDPGLVQTVEGGLTHLPDTPTDGGVLWLYRNHQFGKAAAGYLRSQGELFTMDGRPSIGAGVGEAIVWWERLRRGREVTPDCIERILEQMTPRVMTLAQRTRWREHERTRAGMAWTKADFIERVEWPAGIFEHTWKEVLDRLKPDLSYLSAAIRRSGSKAVAILEAPRIALSTIHAAKGMERDHIVLLTDMSRLTRKEFELNPDAERRVFYVGVTRAKRTLTIVGSENSLF